ncbi:MAG: hypothetical protein DMF97_12735, partial [Acidobacteria bacterium]
MPLRPLDGDSARAIIAAADETLAGRLRGQFVVDVYQAGAGTSHNMNANEVLANRVAELLGEPRGSYTRVHPNDHVTTIAAWDAILSADAMTRGGIVGTKGVGQAGRAGQAGR